MDAISVQRFREPEKAVGSCRLWGGRIGARRGRAVRPLPAGGEVRAVCAAVEQTGRSAPGTL
mgnify:CR=1